MIHEATISYIAIDSRGNDKTCKDQFIIEDRAWFGEVEALLVDKFGGYTDFDIPSIKRSKIKEIVNTRTSDDEKIFLATIADLFYNQDTDEKKEVKYVVALFALDMQDAHRKVNEYMNQGLNDMELKAVKESKLLEVLK